jgi:hypothetical protein
MPGTVPQPLEWPEELTNKDWQKKKGALAKMAGKTDIGATMTDAKSRIRQDRLDFARGRPDGDSGSKVDPEDQGGESAAMTHITKVIEGKVRPKIKEIKELAAAAEAEWSKSKLIPKSSAKHAALVSTTADHYWIALKGNSVTFTNLLDEYDKLVEKLVKHQKDQIELLKPQIEKLEVSLKACAASPSKANYLGLPSKPESVHQRCRSMCNAISVLPNLKAKYWATWEPFGNKYPADARDGDGEAEDVKKMLTNIVIALADFKKNYQSLV